MKLSNRAFSLVEVLTAVAIIGIIVFLALPNVVKTKQDAEELMVIARAESLNISISSFVTANGSSSARTIWGPTGTADGARYILVKSFLAYAPDELTQYQPEGYRYKFTTLDKKVTIQKSPYGAGDVLLY